MNSKWTTKIHNRLIKAGYAAKLHKFTLDLLLFEDEARRMGIMRMRILSNWSLVVLLPICFIVCRSCWFRGGVRKNLGSDGATNKSVQNIERS